MSRCLVTFALILSITITSSTHAQSFSNPYATKCHSAPATSISFNFDVNSTFYSPLMTHSINYRDSLGTTWSNAPMTLLYSTCDNYTFGVPVTYAPPSGAMEWYLRSETDTAVVSESPKNVANTFPVPSYLLTDLGADPVGDAVSATGTYLDLTGYAASYSDTRLYFRLTNNGGGFPTSSGLTFFLYSAGVVDPDETDSVGYALVYVNVPFVLSSGLYKINPADTSFTKIGNITTNISGNSLSLSCNISDLTAQPGWSTWPPPSGFILTAPVTATQTLSGFSTNDIGKGGVFIPSSSFLRVGRPNTEPTLSGLSLTAQAPNTVIGNITYADADGDCPTLREFHFGTLADNMKACTKSYGAGSAFSGGVTVDTAGWYGYYFRFSDGRDTVTTPIDFFHVQFSLPGDADGSGGIDISDAVFLIAYIFASGPAPNPLSLGDANCDSGVDISDAVFLIAYIFGGGPAPCN